MNALTFDTLKFTKTLQSSGIAAEQAEAIAIAFRDATSDSDVASKKDIALAVAELKGEINTLKWIGGAVFAMVTAQFAKQFF